MRKEKAPLLEVFYDLRERQFPLGVGEYVLALRALAKGFGGGSREELTFMCQTLWAKSLEEQAQLREVLEARLPPRLTAEELRALMDEAGQVAAAGDDGKLKNIVEQLMRERPPRARVPEPTVRPAPRVEPPARARRVVVQTLLAAPRPAPAAAPRRAPPPTRADTTFDFVGDLPITRRQMKQGWRYYRRMRRVGVPSELDVQATVEQIHRHGVLLAPVLVPRRRNLARLLILCDVSPSMTPFRRVTQALLDSAGHSGLGGVSALFFNNVPGRVLFRDPRLASPVKAHEALRPFRRAGVLVISDGGAARGNVDADRARRTAEFLRSLRLITRSVAWLNPTPAERWGRTSAGAVRELTAVPMMTVDHAGFVDAVEVLRGRGR